MILHNKHNDKRLEVTFHTGERAVQSMIDCMRSVYGKGGNYVNPEMLEADYIKRNIRQGNLKPFVGIAEDGTPIVTISAIKTPRFDKAWEIGALAVSEGYRGFHLGRAVVDYALKHENETKPLRYTHIVMFYTLVAKMFEDNCFVPVGFLYGVVDSRKHLSQLGYASQKHTLAVYVKNNGKTEIGELFVPKRLTGFVKERYIALGITPVICADDNQPSGTSRVEFEQDDYHKTLYIYVLTSGVDLSERVKTIEQSYINELQTVVLFLNINDSGAVMGYEAMKECGYSFSGVKPLCGEYEYIILSKTNDVFLDSSELKMTPLLSRLFERIGEID